MSASEDVLIILPVRNAVLFPGVVLPIASKASYRWPRAGSGAHATPCRPAAAEGSRGAAQAGATGCDRGRGPENLYSVGTAASIVRFITAPDGTHHLICQGEERFTVLDYVSREPFLVARIEPTRNPPSRPRNRSARPESARESHEAVRCCRRRPGELANAIRNIESIPALADMVASFMDLKLTDKQEILATFDLKAGSTASWPTSGAASRC
jgi:ATP-dependent Lon protease